MLKFIKRMFAWWDGATMGTLFTLFKRYQHVGTDEFGNRYFEEKKPGYDGIKHRYVVYKGYADGSRVPSDWHGWMHHTFDECPQSAPLPRQSFEKDHQPNLTGTVWAWHRKGSLEAPDGAKSRKSYEAWDPDQA